MNETHPNILIFCIFNKFFKYFSNLFRSTNTRLERIVKELDEEVSL